MRSDKQPAADGVREMSAILQRERERFDAGGESASGSGEEDALSTAEHSDDGSDVDFRGVRLADASTEAILATLSPEELRGFEAYLKRHGDAAVDEDSRAGDNVP